MFWAQLTTTKRDARKREYKMPMFSRSARKAPHALRDALMFVLPLGALLCTTDLAIAERSKGATVESCRQRFNACTRRCHNRASDKGLKGQAHTDEMLACVNRTCAKQQDNCTASIPRSSGDFSSNPGQFSPNGSTVPRPGRGLFDNDFDSRGRLPSATGAPGPNAPSVGAPAASSPVTGTPPVTGGGSMPRPSLGGAVSQPLPPRNTTPTAPPPQIR